MTKLRDLVRHGYMNGIPTNVIAENAGTTPQVVRVTDNKLGLLHPDGNKYKPHELRPITLAGPAWSVEGLPYQHKDARAA